MIRLVQSYGRYLGRSSGRDRWDWEVRLVSDTNPLELELVEKVIYTLHPSYERPTRVKTDIESGFALSEKSTGVFEIKATAIMRAGAPVRYTHRLELFFPMHLETVVYDDEHDLLPVS
jgi:transcription initiation factor IIF auxiliary subunit